jgi:hypothetical protein
MPLFNILIAYEMDHKTASIRCCANCIARSMLQALHHVLHAYHDMLNGG